MNSNRSYTSDLVDFKVNVKIKLSALWVSVMLLYIYGDIFALFVPGQIERLIKGNMGIGTTTPLKLFAASLLMTIPAIMVFLSLTLKPRINRWMNIIFGAAYTIIIILTNLTSIDLWWTFDLFFGIVDIVITSMIVLYAWKWPKQ